MIERVNVVSWGNIENPEEPKQWGLKVGKAYVCRNNAPLLFVDKAEANAERERIREKLRTRRNDHDA